MTTQHQVRAAFWADHPHWIHLYRVKKRQNEYPTDTRVAFVDYVDALQKAGLITEALAHRVTL